MVSKSKVFVYGTLKKDHPLHRLLERGKDVKYLGRNYIEGPYMLADMGAFPGLVKDDYDVNQMYKTFGELYAVDAETLASLDYAEGHPNFFQRIKMDLKDNVNTVKAWVYVLTNDVADYCDDWIVEGVWNPTDTEKTYVDRINE